LRRVVRGVCLWYQSENVAKALASCRYRIGHFVELIGGVDVVIAPRLPADVAERCRIVVCARPLLTPALLRDLAQLREAGVVLVADYDDLLFAGDVNGLPDSVRGRSGGLGQGGTRLDGYAAGPRVFDRFTMATRPLAARLHALAPEARVKVVPNGLSEQWVAQGRALYRSFKAGDPLVIRYFAGSPSHDGDFDSIASALAIFLERHRAVRLEVVGPVRFDMSRFPDGRVAALPKVRYEDLPGLLASTWVNLAPLLSNAFNDCKSAIKVLESGAFECPTLASANDDVLRHAELGAPLTLCHTELDWYAALESMLDLERRRTLGRGIAQHVALHGMARSSADAWLSGLGLGEDS
jgi:glycosyltransferase involved in cell wall biosynthesis